MPIEIKNLMIKVFIDNQQPETGPSPDSDGPNTEAIVETIEQIIKSQKER